MSMSVLDRGELRVTTFGPGLNRPYWSGREWQLGTACFWESVAREAPHPTSYRLGRTLNEEIAACILGGFGMTWDIVQPYLERVADAGLLEPGSNPSAAEIRELLLQPATVGVRRINYRFPNQRSERLSGALHHVSRLDLEADDINFRDQLALVPGIGPKTASWIVRNVRGSDSVAIIDVHVARAGIVSGIFDAEWSIARHYTRYERAFLSWSKTSGISAAKLDATIWGALSGRDGFSREILGYRGDGSLRAVWPVWGPKSGVGSSQDVDFGVSSKS